MQRLPSSISASVNASGLDMQIRAVADRIQIAARGAHAAAGGDRRLAHRDAVLRGAVVVGVVRDADLPGRLDQRREERQRAAAGLVTRSGPSRAAKSIVAAPS